MLVVISVSRHSDSKVQETVKGAQAQYIGKIVCGAGNEIDREASTTHSGRLASSLKKVLDRKTNHVYLVKIETEEIFRGSTTAIPEASFAYVVQGEQMQKCCQTETVTAKRSMQTTRL